jgi:hypothetical protein
VWSRRTVGRRRLARGPPYRQSPEDLAFAGVHAAPGLEPRGPWECLVACAGATVPEGESRLGDVRGRAYRAMTRVAGVGVGWNVTWWNPAWASQVA